MKMKFISGLPGVGKTSALNTLIQTQVLSDKYIVRDFDERLVGGREWRLEETKYWIAEGKRIAKTGKVLIVFGLSNPEEIELMEEAKGIDVSLILLDAPGAVIDERLKRRKAKETFATGLRSIFKRAGAPIIDTAERTPTEVVEEIKKLL